MDRKPSIVLVETSNMSWSSWYKVSSEGLTRKSLISDEWYLKG